jgi:hypothetical protein
MLFRTLALTVFAALLTACPVAAADAGTPTLLAGSYWSGFIDHWSGVFQKQNGVVMGALVIGAVCLFIITRGKWKK